MPETFWRYDIRKRGRIVAFAVRASISAILVRTPKPDIPGSTTLGRSNEAKRTEGFEELPWHTERPPCQRRQRHRAERQER